MCIRDRGSGEQGKMQKTGCKIICRAPTTIAVKGFLMMMTMMMILSKLFPVHSRKISNKQFRVVLVPAASTDQMKTSFLTRTMLDWNHVNDQQAWPETFEESAAREHSRLNSHSSPVVIIVIIGYSGDVSQSRSRSRPGLLYLRAQTPHAA